MDTDFKPTPFYLKQIQLQIQLTKAHLINANEALNEAITYSSDPQLKQNSDLIVALIDKTDLVLHDIERLW